MNLVLIATEGESTKTIQSAILACLVMGKYSLKTVGAPDGLLGVVVVQVALGGDLAGDLGGDLAGVLGGDLVGVLGAEGTQ